ATSGTYSLALHDALPICGMIGLRTHMPCCVRHATGPINDRTPTTLGVWTLGVASRPRLTGKLTSAQEDTHLLERRFIKVGSAAWRGTSSGATLPFFCAIMAVKPGRRRSGRRRPEQIGRASWR